MQNQSSEIVIPETTDVYEDKKTKARTIALPVRYSDGSDGVVMLCRLKDETWKPSKTIKRVIVEYK